MAKRKGSARNYKPPKEARQASRDRAYVSFQSEPRLNLVTQELHNHVGQCDVIFGGRQMWLKKKVKKQNGTEKTQSFPIIVDGRRCPNDGVLTKCSEGKTNRRCREHRFSDFWIKNDPEAIEATG